MVRVAHSAVVHFCLAPGGVFRVLARGGPEAGLPPAAFWLPGDLGVLFCSSWRVLKSLLGWWGVNFVAGWAAWGGCCCAVREDRAMLEAGREIVFRERTRACARSSKRCCETGRPESVRGLREGGIMCCETSGGARLLAAALRA